MSGISSRSKLAVKPFVLISVVFKQVLFLMDGASICDSSTVELHDPIAMQTPAVNHMDQPAQ